MFHRYTVWFKNVIIEEAGYFSSVRAARVYARKRYGALETLEVQAQGEAIRHPVAA